MDAEAVQEPDPERHEIDLVAKSFMDAMRVAADAWIRERSNRQVTSATGTLFMLTGPQYYGLLYGLTHVVAYMHGVQAALVASGPDPDGLAKSVGELQAKVEEMAMESGEHLVVQIPRA